MNNTENYEIFKFYCNLLHSNNINHFGCYGGDDGVPIQLFNRPADEKTYKELLELNEVGNKDIYTVVQPSKGFEDIDVSSFTFVFADWDCGRDGEDGNGQYFSLEDVNSWKMEKVEDWKDLIFIKKKMIDPNFIVETRNGYHLYWKLKEGEITDANIYRSLQKAIARHLGSDDRIFNPARIMRVPGFYWKKTSEKLDKFLVNIKKGKK